MDMVLSWGESILYGGLGNLAAYLAAHVLLCLLPAFFIAGAMSALIPKETVTRFLGRNSRKAVSYPAAAAAGSLLAVCSCTIVPLFAGIYKKGAGLGPAITFLFFAPAANILALVYTGGIIGPDLALARFLLSLTFGIGIGLIMALIFHRDDAAHDRATDTAFGAQGAGMGRMALVFLFVWVALLLAGTLKLNVLTSTYLSFELPFADAQGWQAALDRLVPYDAARGEEGVSLQGVVLIGLLGAIGFAAWRGLENIVEGSNAWTWISLTLIAATLLVAALAVQPVEGGLRIGVTGKFFSVGAALAALHFIVRHRLSEDELRDWLWESWRFVKQIFPLLVVGVFIVGMIRVLIRPEWIQILAGSNSLTGNLAGVVFGVFMYFPTLVEVPIAKMFLELGMHRGPLLAYLMSDPELSLQSILIISAIIGRKKTFTYVGLVALFSAAAGLIYGAWIDGASLLMLALYLAGFIALLAALLSVTRRRASSLKGV
ncbi:permease [Thauera aromatica]|uniref:Putative permease n=1 Tax=Thauera aromatica K172 TaxID=44139 RepID=A0A2R4BL41_THAAR|nr:permease [Thauera aromatica]AVR88031.1 putative permease [Thauera aromatica K172]